MKSDEQIKMFDNIQDTKQPTEPKNTTRIKALEKAIEELKHKVDLLYKSLRR